MSEARSDSWKPAPAKENVRRRLDELGLLDGPLWAVVHPGATAPSRRYPPELFAAAVRDLTAMGLSILFTGGAEEQELVEQIRRLAGCPSRSLAGQLTLDELAALIGEAPVVISNNTGPVHIAAACGTPVVDLCGPRVEPRRVVDETLRLLAEPDEQSAS